MATGQWLPPGGPTRGLMVVEAQQVIMMRFLIFLPVGGWKKKASGEADELQGEGKRGYVQRGRNQSL